MDADESRLRLPIRQERAGNSPVIAATAAQKFHNELRSRLAARGSVSDP